MEFPAGILGGVDVRVKIVWCGKKGWGLFADQQIEDGRFVCECAGEVITSGEARRRQATYDELSLKDGFGSSLLVIREYLPSGTACLRMNIDATRAGDVARFFNHSCDGGNLSAEIVRDAGDLLSRVCFFASRGIDKDEELTFSLRPSDERIEGRFAVFVRKPMLFGNTSVGKHV